MKKSYRISVGEKCNLHCDYCITRERTNTDFNKCIEQIKNWQLKDEDEVVWIANGEPTLNEKEFINILKNVRIKSRKCEIRVYTNGTIYNEKIFDFCLKYNINLILSLEFEDFNLQKRRYKNKESIFNSLIINLEKIKKKYQLEVYKGMSIVYDEKNIKRLDEIINFYYSKGVSKDFIDFMSLDGNDYDDLLLRKNRKNFNKKNYTFFKKIENQETFLFYKTDIEFFKTIKNKKEDISKDVINITKKKDTIIIRTRNLNDLSDLRNLKIIENEQFLEEFNLEFIDIESFENKNYFRWNFKCLN